MLGNKLILLGLLINVLILCTRADEVAKPEEEHEHVQSNIIPQSTAHPVETSFPSALSSLLANGGVVAAVVIATGLLSLLVAPFFGIRICSILGNCQDATAYQGYSANPNVYSDYQGYQQGTYNSPIYQKRSLEYVGPILKALGNAYDKYSKTMATTAQTRNA